MTFHGYPWLFTTKTRYLPYRSQFIDGILVPKFKGLLTSMISYLHLRLLFLLWVYLALCVDSYVFVTDFSWMISAISVAEITISEQKCAGFFRVSYPLLVHISTGCFTINASVKSKRILVVPSMPYHIPEFIFKLALCFQSHKQKNKWIHLFSVILPNPDKLPNILFLFFLSIYLFFIFWIFNFLKIEV